MGAAVARRLNDRGADVVMTLEGRGPASAARAAGITLRDSEAELAGWADVVLSIVPPGEALALARRIAAGPTFANGITKPQLNQEWSMSLDQAIEAEAQAQALCMQTKDFERAYRAFVAKQKPVFEGN